MQWIKSRCSGDRGAVAVWVGVLMVPLLIVAALAVDIGAMQADRQRLQHGADAAALAIAHDCAMDACGDVDRTAQDLADEHEPFGEPAVASVVEPTDLANGWVEVEATADRNFWFAPIIDIDDVSLAARSAASWGAPSGGRSALPFIFSTCQLEYLSVLDVTGDGTISLNEDAIGVPRILRQSKGVDSGCDAPYGNNFIPGGFGWVSTDAADCSMDSQIGAEVPRLSGNSQGSHGHPCYLRMQDAIDEGGIALLPVFENVDVAAKTYIVKGYIAVTLERYGFQGNRCYAGEGEPCSGPSANGNEGWIEIIPQRYIASDADFETSPTAPDLGAQIVQLRLPEG